MAIFEPSQMDFSNKKFATIISGAPGVGKTTLALSAPNPVLIDFDKGISRVSAKHRRTTIISKNYEEVLEDMKAQAVKDAETIIIDTGGSFITYLQDWAMRDNPTLNKQKNGAISLKGFGAVKSEFVNFTNKLQYIMDKNIIYIFHTVEEKDREGNTVNRLMCEGAARNIVWQPCDLGCYVHMVGADRFAGFSPTEQYFAKGCFGIKGLVKVPALDDNTPNDFLTRLFEMARKNIAEESKVFEADNEVYAEAMRQGSSIVEGITDGESATAAPGKIRALAHALTSEKEIKAMFTARVKELGLTWDKQAGAYVAKT